MPRTKAAKKPEPKSIFQRSIEGYQEGFKLVKRSLSREEPEPKGRGGKSSKSRSK
jgi:hypothetical protein